MGKERWLAVVERLVSSSYKNKGQDLEEGRRRREEEGVQLRKAKRDEQVCSKIPELAAIKLYFFNMYYRECMCINDYLNRVGNLYTFA